VVVLVVLAEIQVVLVVLAEIHVVLAEIQVVLAEVLLVLVVLVLLMPPQKGMGLVVVVASIGREGVVVVAVLVVVAPLLSFVLLRMHHVSLLRLLLGLSR
jgi:hypothetical protein